MNKLTITEKGLVFLQTLSEDFHPQPEHNETILTPVTLPSLKREKIEKLHRSKNRKYEMTAERIRQKHRNIQETRLAAYDKENDNFWKDWKTGFDIAAMWNKQSKDSKNRYQQRVKERNDNLATQTQTKRILDKSLQQYGH